MAVIPSIDTWIDRFWAKVDLKGPTPADRAELGPCWLWLGTKDNYGYGVFSIAGQNFKAHRLSYHHVNGGVDDALTLDHLCRQKDCVYPGHLEAVDAAENTRRANPRRTHCLRGHEFTPENTYIKPNRSQGCRACNNLLHRKYRARRLDRLTTEYATTGRPQPDGPATAALREVA
jgi:hypothetical protein